MEKITREINAVGAAKRWLGQYPDKNTDTYKQLKNLGQTPNPDDVDRIIGNKSWTSVPNCDECEKECTVVVSIGEEIDYESATADICKDCLIKALALL